MKRLVCTYLLAIASMLTLWAKTPQVRLYGYVLDTDNRGIELANVYIEGTTVGTTTNQNGYYDITVEMGDTIVMVYSMIGYETIRQQLYTRNDVLGVNVVLPTNEEMLSEVTVRGIQRQTGTMDRTDVSVARLMPDATGGGIESLLITFAGVRQNNEMSSQYNVRGGTFDENSVYVNGLEVHRPLLIRSGQQEGLSFVNTDMVENVNFSAGGFDAKYGDKMSSLQGTIAVIPGIGCDGLFFSTLRLGSSSFNLYFSSVYDGDNCLWNSKNQNELFDKYFGKYAAVRLGSEPMESQFDYNHNHVTHLWVWGKPQAADYEYLRTKRLAELELLDMRDADIDTLQAEAFDITLPESNASPKYIVLPKKLKHISDNALCVYPNITTYEVTGAYPSLGKDVYSRKGKTSNHIFVVPSIDNKYLILHTIDPTGGSSGPGRVPIKRLAMVDNDSIYGSSVMSKGGDTLYYVNASKGKGYAVANGMKTIAANAMENKLLENAFNIPETVDSIGNRVFNGLRIVETRSNALQYYLACYRANPPMIGMEVFDESSLVTGSHVFYVNKESISDYKNTKGWDKLYYGDIDDVSGVEEVKTAEKQSPYYYDLQGRKVKKPTKGLYIKDGKKNRNKREFWNKAII